MKLSLITPTHNPKYIGYTWESIKQQFHKDWEWVVVPNGPDVTKIANTVRGVVGGDPRVRIVPYEGVGGIGAIKQHAFMLGTGDALIELDHDDLLAPHALAAIDEALQENADAGFFFSDCANFSHGSDGQGEDHTYMLPDAADAWKANGWRFTSTEVGGARPGNYAHPLAFEPSAAALSTILWAPNHVRVWRTKTYHDLGGHDARFDVCDDHELLIRTYLHTRMRHIPDLLYLYRCSGSNTWAPRADEIGEQSRDLGRRNLEKLILREAGLRGLSVFDLGTAIEPRTGWTSVDQHGEVDVKADLRGTWPWDDNSVAAFRAYDFLEHLPDQQHTMSEIYRCLAPGGWLLSKTPSTDGRGAFQDPTHVSYWNQNSFWYWTRDAQAKYIGNDHIRFSESLLYTQFPTPWHREHNIPYVIANLIALKPGYQGPR